MIGSGAVAQLGELIVCNDEVAGSIPVSSRFIRANNSKTVNKHGQVPGLQKAQREESDGLTICSHVKVETCYNSAGGCGFESRLAHGLMSPCSLTVKRVPYKGL